MKRFILLLLVLICMLAACATAQEVPMETNEPAPTMPERPLVNQEPSVGFAWEVRDGVAFLTGLGEVTQTDIVIPAQVSLVQTENGWTEAVESGAVYPVTVCGDAFRYCSELTTVTFNSGVVIEDNRMSRNNYGMFAMCKALTGVYNIPDTVTDMNATFAYCQSLTEIDRFPYCLTTLKSCFRNCSALVEIPELPETVTDMSGCFVECTSLTGLAKLPDALTDLEGCFRNCTALVEVPTVPDAVTSMANCFAGCVSLSGVPNLPASTTDMQGCFQGCTGLVQVPEFPSGVTDLSNCFQNCTSLVSVPTLPDSVVTMAKCFWKCSALERIDAFPTALKALDGCFVGCELLQSIPALPDTLMSMQQAFVQCTSLGGSVEIPQSIFKGKRNTAAFWGCCEIEEFIFDTCQFGADIGNYLKHEVKTTYRYDHITEGKCPHCGLTDQEIPAPPSLFIMENIPEYYESWFIDFIENTVPVFLKEGCRQYVFTDDIEKYNTRDFTINGHATIERIVRIQLRRSNVSGMKYTIYHELGHLYDIINKPEYTIIWENDRISSMGCSAYGNFGKYSNTDEWKVLHQNEGKTASRWYGSSYKTFTDEEKRLETFAISVGKYFTDPSALESRCPGMYAYVDALFRDLIAAEEAAKAAEVPAA